MENIGEMAVYNENDRAYWRQYLLETDANGFLVDRRPEVYHKTSPDAQVVPRRINVRFLQPPQLEPTKEGPVSYGPIKVIMGEPIRRTGPTLPPRRPPPILLVEEPPQPPPLPPPGPPRLIPSAPIRLPRTTVTDVYRSAPLLPDVYIERWLPYGPRPKGSITYIPAPPPPPPPKLHNIINVYTPQVRYQREVKRFGVTIEDPDAYRQRHGGRMLDKETLLAQAQGLGIVPLELDLPPRIPDGPNNLNRDENQGDVSYPQQLQEFRTEGL